MELALAESRGRFARGDSKYIRRPGKSLRLPLVPSTCRIFRNADKLRLLIKQSSTATAGTTRSGLVYTSSLLISFLPSFKPKET